MAVFFVSDTHFGHRNILKYDNSPFETIEERDKKIIKNWNERVEDRDVVYVLGDVSFLSAEKTKEVLQSLKGEKRLIIGNHDKVVLNNSSVSSEFSEIKPYAEISEENKKIVLCHYPILTYNGHFYGAVHLYGHVHATMEYTLIKRFQEEMESEQCRKLSMFNVGVMLPYMDYGPRTLKEILASNG